MPYAVARHHTGPRIAPARALGRPVSKLLANGVAETTVYDDAGRPTVRSHSQAGGLVLARYTATYDAAGNRLRVEELDGTFEYGYDASNQLISERRSGASAYAISYTYDAAGNRLAVDQSGAAARSGWLGRSEYAYNAADELLTVTPQAPDAGEVTLAQQVSPPLTGAAYALTLPLRTSFVYTLDTATLDLIGASGAWDDDNAWHLALTARDDAGIVSTLATTTWAAAGAGRVELTPAELVTLDADATPRLGVSVSRVGTPPPLVGLAGSASLSGALKPTRYAYDANGNTVGIDGPGGPVTLTWDAENRLIAVDAPDGSETYDYDSTTSVPGKVTGLRRSKTTAAGTTHFVWDQQNLLAELDGALAPLVQYTGFPGFWGGLASARAGASGSFYGFDLSANTRSVFDALGAVDETALYSAFGPTVAGNLSGPMRFGGEAQYYTDARWLQVRARELEVLTGRWLSRDPLGHFDADWPFEYVGNGPVGAVDESGLLQWLAVAQNLLALLADVGMVLSGASLWWIAAYVAARLALAWLQYRECMRSLERRCLAPCYRPNVAYCALPAAADVVSIAMGLLPGAVELVLKERLTGWVLKQVVGSDVGWGLVGMLPAEPCLAASAS